MDLTRFDKILWRFNGIVIALGCLFLIGSLVVALFGLLKLLDVGSGLSSYPVENKDVKENEDLSINYFRRLQGTDLMAASLTDEARQSYSAFSSPSSYSASASYGGMNGARNVLFFDTRSGKSRWLAPDNTTRYLSENALMKDTTVESDKQETIAFLYETVPYQLPEKRMEESPRSVLFYNLSSGASKTLVEGAERILAVQQLSKDEAIIMYAIDGKNFALSIRPTSGDEISKRELPAVPATE